MTSSHNGSVQKGLSTTILNLAAGGTRQIEVPSGQYTIRLFVWNSLSNDIILSNTRTVPMGLWPEDDSSLLRVAVGLTDCSGQEFSLAASAGEETVYAIQRSVPENGVYEMLIPRASVAVEPDRAEYAWDSPLTVMVNGSKRVIKAQKEKAAEYLKARAKETEPAMKVPGSASDEVETEEAAMKAYAKEMAELAMNAGPNNGMY